MKKYKTGTHDHFDKMYLKFKNKSQILGNGTDVASTSNILWDKAALSHAVIEYLGDEEGTYILKGETITALIPTAKQEIKAIEKQWKQVKRQRMNEGFAEPTEEEWPEDLLNQRLKWEARLNILEEEIVKINEALAEYDQPEADESDKQVLRYGLSESGQLHDGVLCEMDGQIVAPIDDIPVIQDIRSPFNGMSIPEYRKLAKVWRKEREMADREYLKVLQAEARKQFKPVPQYFSSIGGITPVSKELLPDWPEGVKNYLNEETDTSQ